MYWIFDKTNTFCISLETALERRKNMVARFSRFGLDATFWRASLPTELENKFDCHLKPTQCACAQSHINIWRKVVNESIPYVLILEDDAMFDIRWREKLGEFSNVESWDAIFLNCADPIVPAFFWEKVVDQNLTGGYILSLEGAKKLLDMFSGVAHASDWMTNRLQQYGRCWGYFPWLVIQEGVDSTIGSNLELDHEKVVRCLGEIGYDISGNYV